jgi:chromosome partitioning protein
MTTQHGGHGLGWPDGTSVEDQTGRGLGWPAPPGTGSPEPGSARTGSARTGSARTGSPEATSGQEDDVSRETPSGTSSLWARVGLTSPTAASIAAAQPIEPEEDLPIGRAAEASVRAQRLLREPLPRPPHPRVVVVANQKGGVGKTTSAVNIAAGLALHGARVLVIDMDPQGNASTALGLPHHAEVAGTYDVLVDGLPLAAAVQTCPDVPGLLGVPSTIDLAGADIELVQRPGRELLLRHAVADYLQDHAVDYVFIDCPPTLGLLTVNALAAGMEVLIPIQCEYYALEGLSQLLGTIDLVRRGLNPALVVSTVLLTMYDGRTRLSSQVADEVRRHFGPAVLPTVVPRSVRLSEAPGYGQTVHTYSPGSPGALSYLEAARDMARRPEMVKESA